MKLPKRRRTSNPTVVERKTKPTKYDNPDGGSAEKPIPKMDNATGRKRRGKGKWK